MLYIEKLEDGRTHTYSDTFKIRQVETGIIYDDAVDVLEYHYEETDTLLEQEQISDSEALEIITGVTQ